MPAFVRAVFTLFLVTLIASPARAAWPNSPFTNLPVCMAPNAQYGPSLVPDGAGGAILTWYDYRSGGTPDIYAQHVRASGSVDPAWPANGRAICTAAGSQYSPALVSDGAGGAIITWTDVRGGATGDIYAQHVLASGVVDPAWPANGRALCTAASDQSSPMIESDGAGGAIVTWLDYRTSASYDVYAQRVLASGAVDPAWPANGVALCLEASDQQDARIVTDGAGGAIVCWLDLRSGVSTGIYAQRVRVSGTVDPAWPVDGLALCTATDYRTGQKVVSDGTGGAIVTWYDFRSGTNFDIYAQHVMGSGMVDWAWPFDGLAVCTAANGQQSPAIAPDGAGGAIIAWHDLRTLANNDIYAQHVLPSGVVDPVWPIDGSAVCTAADNQYVPTIAPDGAGGAIVCWLDYRLGSQVDLFAQHMLASGTADPAWPAGGRGVCTAANGQSDLAIVSDGAGGAIASWYDSRNAVEPHIYAQRVARFGYLGTPEAEIVSVKDVPNDQGGRVKLSWNASYLDLAQDANLNYYDVLRSVPTNLAAQMKSRGARVRALAGDGFALRPGDLVADATGAYYWEYLASISALHYLSGYSYVAPTLGDSVAGSNPRTAFLVVARNGSSSMFWLSRPDSGYSTDNLAPAAPAPFTGEYASGSTQLHWNRNTEGDLAGYRLYRGTTPTFVPGPGNLVAAVPDTGYADTPAAPSWYKLTAVDSHGNESPVATLLPAGTLGVEDAIAELSFAVPTPNPASARTTLRWALSRAGSVRLAVYDAAGRRVRELANSAQEAGEHSAVWDLSDDGGRAVGAGLYFARFEAEGRTWVRRVAVTR